jgi:Flp pilus assembly protein TadG
MLPRLIARIEPLRRFARARRGSAAVEFAFVVVPFFLLMVGLAEVAMMGFAQTSLDYAVSETARQIRTGQAQLGGVTAGEIEDEVCDQLNRFLVMDCEANLLLDVNRYDSFLDAGNDFANPVQNNEFQPGPMDFAPGAPSDIVVVRAYYRWRVITPMFEAVFQNVSGGERILSATMMFRNEPYQ